MKQLRLDGSYDLITNCPFCGAEIPVSIKEKAPLSDFFEHVCNNGKTYCLADPTIDNLYDFYAEKGLDSDDEGIDIEGISLEVVDGYLVFIRIAKK